MEMLQLLPGATGFFQLYFTSILSELSSLSREHSPLPSGENTVKESSRKSVTKHLGSELALLYNLQILSVKFTYQIKITK